MKLFLCALGLVFVMEGLPYFVSPGKMKELLDRIKTMSDGSLRIFGLAAILMGLLLIYFGRD